MPQVHGVTSILATSHSNPPQKKKYIPEILTISSIKNKTILKKTFDNAESGRIIHYCMPHPKNMGGTAAVWVAILRLSGDVLPKEWRVPTIKIGICFTFGKLCCISQNLHTFRLLRRCYFLLFAVDQGMGDQLDGLGSLSISWCNFGISSPSPQLQKLRRTAFRAMLWCHHVTHLPLEWCQHSNPWPWDLRNMFQQFQSHRFQPRPLLQCEPSSSPEKHGGMYDATVSNIYIQRRNVQ